MYNSARVWVHGLSEAPATVLGLSINHMPPVQQFFSENAQSVSCFPWVISGIAGSGQPKASSLFALELFPGTFCFKFVEKNKSGFSDQHGSQVMVVFIAVFFSLNSIACA